MNRRRIVIGWLLSLLGGIGVVASLAAIIGVWMLSYEVAGSVTRTASAVTEFTRLTHARATGVEDRLGESREKLLTLQETFDAAAESEGIDPEAVQRMAAELKTHIAKLREWIAVAGSTGEFMTLLKELLGSVSAITGAEDRVQATSAIVDGADQVRQASALLEELTQDLDEALQDVDRMALASQAKPLLRRWDTSLAGVESKVTGFNEGVKRAEDTVMALEGALLFRIRMAAWILSLLLIWQAVAQACLASWGGRLRKTSPDGLGTK